MGYADCLRFAFPYCSDESFGLTQANYIASRIFKNSIENSSPEDLMRIDGIICGSGSSYVISNDFNNLAENANSSNGWAVYLFHIIDKNGGFYITSQNLINHLNYLLANDETFWVETFSNVIKYNREGDSA